MALGDPQRGCAESAKEGSQHQPQDALGLQQDFPPISCSIFSEKQPTETGHEVPQFVPITTTDEKNGIAEKDYQRHAENGRQSTEDACQLSSSQYTSADGGAPLSPRMSTDPQGNTYPEGGREAYVVVIGSFFALFGSLGLSNTIGTFQAWISVHQLKDYSQSSISWIFGTYTFLMFFGGLQVGPVFDAKGPKWLVLAGTILTVLSVALLGSCEEYWHFMLVYSIIGGIGITLVFTPAIASPGHFFYRLRGRATGLAATGGSIGGIVFPLMLDSLYAKVGFAWATRAVALVSLVTMSAGCLLMKSRLPKKRATKENILPDLRILMEPVFAFTTAGIFFIEWGLFIPITFMTSYALHHNMPRGLSYQLLALLNTGSFFGRWIPGFTADYMGRFNTMIATVVLCLLSTACLWLPAGDSIAMMVAYALIFGFASGSNISLTPVCVGQVCKTENYGRYYATAYTVVSFGTLTGTPIAGSILTRNGGDYWGLITFTSCCYFAGLICFIIAKVLRVGWNPLIID
ncbi:MFS monocarboxylate transporter [Coccidioides immitis RS]|uniref:MFS monocarboxylate transporter n=3 Tax=Coccidioides immitis TaxID=5501 RepID=J3KDM3_COCIM|nr:MFS monocarboxylate transporter [Coccidioides immitis RS]EAS33481.3 MFS monocarboxylate transporter [Coccidioides immitis RS]KMP04647.1 hypothetical protein CIRG_04328 [Coccidioides immitis RMSCC 2394]TPX21180.1 hypothetical protein DIZ76_015135 [Coccidioides immitis]